MALLLLVLVLVWSSADANERTLSIGFWFSFWLLSWFWFWSLSWLSSPPWPWFSFWLPSWFSFGLMLLAGRDKLCPRRGEPSKDIVSRWALDRVRVSQNVREWARERQSESNVPEWSRESRIESERANCNGALEDVCVHHNKLKNWNSFVAKH